MFIWLFEIPIGLIVATAVILAVIGIMAVELISNALFAIGMFVASLAIPVLITSAGLLYVSKEMVVACKKIMAFLVVNG